MNLNISNTCKNLCIETFRNMNAKNFQRTILFIYLQILFIKSNHEKHSILFLNNLAKT